MTAHTKGPTMEQLHAAWLTRNRPRWPATFQEAIEHPIFSRVLKLKVLHTELVKLRHEAKTSPVMKREPNTTVTSGPVRPVRTSKPGFWMDTDPEPLDP